MSKPIGYYMSSRNEIIDGLTEAYGWNLQGISRANKLALISLFSTKIYFNCKEMEGIGDGTPFTAEDVLNQFNFDTLDRQQKDGIFDAITDLETLDEETILGFLEALICTVRSGG